MIGRSNAVEAGGIEWKELILQSANVMRAPPVGVILNFAIDGVPAKSVVVIRIAESDPDFSVIVVAYGEGIPLNPNAEAIFVMTSEYDGVTGTITGQVSFYNERQCEYAIIPVE